MDYVVSLFCLLFLIGLALISRLIGAPGSGLTHPQLLGLLLISGLPVYLFLIYTFLGKPFFGLPPRIFLMGSALLTLSILLLFSGQNIFNALKGIPNKGYWNGQGSVYYNGRLIVGVSPENFSEIKYPERHFMKSSKIYMTDGESIYFLGKKIPGAKNEDFQFVSQIGGNLLFKFSEKFYYAKSSQEHFINSEKINVGDSFRFYNQNYAGDDQQVFYFNWQQKKLEPLSTIQSPSTFQFLDETEWFGRDDQRLYFLYYGVVAVVEGADKKSFQTLFSGEKQAFASPSTYYKDKDKIYALITEEGQSTPSLQELPSADHSSFTVTGYNGRDFWDAKDDLGYFWNGKRVDPQAESESKSE